MKKNEFETAYEAWNIVWADERGRMDWMAPEPFITSMVAYLKDNGVKEILDLGSGIGRHSLELAKAGFKVSAIDASETGIAYLNEMVTKYDLKNIDTHIGSFTNIPYDENSFDAIVSFNVIYHGNHESVINAINEIKRVMRPGGFLIISMLSKKNVGYGKGELVAENTWTKDQGNEVGHPHYYVNEHDILALFKDFEIYEMLDTAHKKPNSYHWHIFSKFLK